MPASDDKPVLLIVSQVYVPDPASVGQHLHDVAHEMVQRGHRVIVLTAARGYDDPSQHYDMHEVRDGVEIRRFAWSSFGKGSIATRLAGGGAFLAQAFAHALRIPRIDRLLISTSPPMCAAFALALHKARGVPVTYWAMDINPDQIVATGKLGPSSAPVRAFDLMNRQILDTAACVIALDRFMAERLQKKGRIRGELVVLPPWPHVEAGEALLDHADNPFRDEHGLRDKFVVMYSGNLSPVHPITTLLEAAKLMLGREDIVFLFVGGGLGKLEIERFVAEHSLRNVRTLPYQPLSMLRQSLSAADMHLVSMGDDMVGIVHPCKIYGAMAVGRPIIVLGPHESHLTEIVLGNGIGIQVKHGDANAAAQRIASLASTAPKELQAMGARARDVVASTYSKARLCGALCDAIERT